MEKKHEAIVIGRIFKWEEHLQTEIEIENLIAEHPSPISEYRGSLKTFLYNELMEAENDKTVYFMAKVEANYVVEPKEKIDFSLVALSYMNLNQAK